MKTARPEARLGRRSRERKGERGAAAVEFALVLPVLLVLVLGAIDWGWYFYVREVVTNSAREGARAGSVDATGATLTTAQAAATAYLDGVSLAASGRTVGATLVDVTLSSGTTVHTVRVVVSYPVGPITGFTSFIPATMTATAQMRREGM